MKLSAPYPYFGAKGVVAETIWAALGDVGNYVEPFFGSGAVLLARSRPGKVETANDACAFVPNFWRAVQADAEAVAYWADWPVSEADLHARHGWLVERADEVFVERLTSEPEYFDAKVAGWWVWGQSAWIGGGWCERRFAHQHRRPRLGGRGGRPHYGAGVTIRKKPALCGNGGGVAEAPPKAGLGINRRQLPRLSGCDGSGVSYGAGINVRDRRADLIGYFKALQDRLRGVRFVCGDWTRVVTDSVTVSHGLTGVLLDPPYGEESGRKARLYATDSMTVAVDAARWAIERGDDPRMRIVLCGYEGEHRMPRTWREVAWKSHSGYASASKERLWLSPHCLGGVNAAGPLFASLGGAA